MRYTIDKNSYLSINMQYIANLSIQELDNSFILPLIRDEENQRYYKGG